jgi:hypothetical protein
LLGRGPATLLLLRLFLFQVLWALASAWGNFDACCHSVVKLAPGCDVSCCAATCSQSTGSEATQLLNQLV